MNRWFQIEWGPLKGFHWLGGHPDDYYWKGGYERAYAEVFIKAVRRGMVVYDIGAHLGYYTFLASRLVGPTGYVYACEPDRENVLHLLNICWKNHCTNVMVLPVAVTAESGIYVFQPGANSCEGRLHEDGTECVSAVALDEMPELYPDVIKIDVEGEELNVLRGGVKRLQIAQPILFLSVHGDESKRACTEWLQRRSYTILTHDASHLIATPCDAGSGG